MKVLQVIHGYPMRYNAGSEVYTQTLCHGLAQRHEVHVFTREEEAFAPDYRLRLEKDADDPRVSLHVVNNPRLKDRFLAVGIDRRFVEVLDDVQPDVVHVGHLNHLSTSLVQAAALREIPIVFTLHDYWLMCPRGQFMQMFPEDPTNIWAACDGQADRRCAERCYARYFSGAPEDREAEVTYWADWVSRRMRHVRAITELIDLFIAPARYLHDRFRDAFGLPPRKLVYLDYGFARERMAGRQRAPGEPFTFGYMGTHIPAKGIHHLLEAFGMVRGDARLRIWGRPRGQDTDALKAMAESLPHAQGERVEWLGEYKNQEVVQQVLNRCDAIVVPSVWVENSPLVIHEAQQARVPVIAAAAGGMAEYVHHEVNGLLFEHRSPDALAEQMQRMADEPALARRLGARGYLYSDSGDVPSVEDHVRAVEALYEQVVSRRDSAKVRHRRGPWRITLDTNPDDCNLHCIMCEEHSHDSPRHRDRVAGRVARRRMDPALMRKVVAEAVSLGVREIIPSTMGEPLLWPHLEELVGLCREQGVLLNLTTNGTFPRRSAREWAGLLTPVTSDIKVSINGATAATQEHIMVGSRWARMLENVLDFIAVRNALADGHRCRVTFQVTYLQDNIDELPALVELAARLGVDRVKGHHVWVHFPELRSQSMRRSPEAAAHWNRVVARMREAAGDRVLLDNVPPIDPQAPDDLAPGGRCPFLGEEAWVSAEGRFDPCCAPDEMRRSLGEFGNLHEQSLSEIWGGHAYGSLLKTYRTRTLCLGCNMRRPVEVLP